MGKLREHDDKCHRLRLHWVHNLIFYDVALACRKKFVDYIDWKENYWLSKKKKTINTFCYK